MKIILILLLSLVVADAQLVVTVAPPKVTGNKAVVPLAMQTKFKEKIESARVAVLLMDEQGKMVGQSTRWVIGGESTTNGLAPSATNTFHFVITAEKSFASTNLTAKVNFTRLVLENGKVGDLQKDVQIQNANQ